MNAEDKEYIMPHLRLLKDDGQRILRMVEALEEYIERQLPEKVE